MLTNAQKAALATELCGMVEHKHKMYPSWIIHPDDYKKRQHIYHFDPVSNWNHMRLVLEGLVKKGYRYKIYSPGAYTDEGLGPVGTFECWIYKTDNGIRIACCGCSVDSLGSAVCKAGLEVIGRDGG